MTVCVIVFRWVRTAGQCFWLLHHSLYCDSSGYNVLLHSSQDGKASIYKKNLHFFLVFFLSSAFYSQGICLKRTF